MRRILLLMTTVAPLAMAAIQEPVRVDGGLITGTPTPQWTPDVRVFRGIPYAAPPVGDLRWRPPQPVIPWQGAKAADHFSAACLQAPTDTEGNAWREGMVPVSEDCLFINVWTPAQNADARLPVMVFIHGGGNTRGAASENQYDGAYLAKKGVVFVSFNYRMGAFGFLAHPDLTRESEHHASGNYAALDQIAALQWVQRNIAKFGGDPATVMIFGHSAGAGNTCVLLASPLAKGLFHRALTQSSASLARNMTLADAEANGAKFAESLGAKSIADLRRMPAEALMKGARMGGAVVDGWVLPQDVYSTFAAGKQNDVPTVVGSMAADGVGVSAPRKASEVPDYAKKTFGPLADKYLKAFPAATDEQAAKSAVAFAAARAMAGNRAFARMQTKTGKSKVYWYLFSHVSPIPDGLVWGGRPAKDWGAYHGGEIVYVFNAFPLQDWAWRPVDLKVGDLVSSLWVSFAKTGNPNSPGLPEWPSFDPKTEMLLNIGDALRAQAPPDKLVLDLMDELPVPPRR
ncbi:MAG: carboxylesterase family protein [Acidobacteriia bacterium]|nr:carboxylesterase family protein [Terriglobia bacterium]